MKFIIHLIAIILLTTITPTKAATKLYSNESALIDAKNAILAGDNRELKKQLKTTNVNALLPDGSSLLAWAVESQNLGTVELLLKKGAKADINSADANPFSPLILACQYGDTAIISALLDKKANVNTATDNAISALQLCAANANSSIVKRMINMGAEIDAANIHGQTSLMWAAANAKIDVMKLLVSFGADINAQTHKGFTPLLFAIKSGTLNAPMAAVELGANLNITVSDGTNPAQLAMYQHNYEFAYWLIRQDAADLTAFDRNGNQLLHVAVHANQAKLVELLLAKGADPRIASGPSTMKWRFESNFKTEDYIPPSLTPIEIASNNDYQDILSLLNGTM